VVDGVKKDCKLGEEFEIIAIPGVELTHIPPKKIPGLAKRAKKAGAEIVVIHGETIVEPVPEFTNRYAVESPDVDILAHPGFLSPSDAEKALDNGVFLEITSRKGHSLTNGVVARVATSCRAQLLVNTDAHAPGDLIDYAFARKVALGAGLTDSEADRALHSNPRDLLKRIGYSGSG
jgi:histidinol phosphatase-like PHP family hydrolase